jgi:hypothetical protein
MTTHEAAKKYIARGWSVFPLRPRDKRPLIEWKEFQTRMATEEEIAKWFLGTKNNIGIVTGKISDLTVLDCDSEEAIAFVEKKRVRLTKQVQTSNGRHYYFRYLQGSTNFQSHPEWQKIDLRSEGGYVAAPPSIHPSGAAYAWMNGVDAIEESPCWLLPTEKSLTPQPSVTATQDYWAPAVYPGRNKALTRLAGHLLPNNSTHEALAMCRAWNLQNTPPLPDDELIQTVNSIAQAEARKADLNSHFSLISQERIWPQLAPEALHGIVGDIVRTIAPHTEADPVTLIAHTIAEFSAIIRRSAFTKIDGYQSPLVFWPVLVGNTSKA